MFISGPLRRTVSGNLILGLLLGAAGAPLAASGKGGPGKKAKPTAMASAETEDPEIRAQMLALLAGLKGFEAKEDWAASLDLRVGLEGLAGVLFSRGEEHARTGIIDDDGHDHDQKTPNVDLDLYPAADQSGDGVMQNPTTCD